jgi:hypothetical protein
MRLSESKAAATAITSLRDDEETAACRGYQRNLLTLSTRSKSRTIVGVRSRRQRRLATTALLGLAPARSARASAATTEETSALASMMTRV